VIGPGRIKRYTKQLRSEGGGYWPQSWCTCRFLTNAGS